LVAGKETFRWDTSKFREYVFAENSEYVFKLGVIPKKKEFINCL
jgi:hypothetical protein